MEVLKKDWRLHAGQKVMIDIRQLVYEIVNLTEEDKAFDISLVEGYYLPGQLQPVLLDNRSYYYFNQEGERCLFVKPFKGIGDIFDGTKHTIVVSKDNAVGLRRTPSDNVHLSQMILDYVDSTIRGFSRHPNHRGIVGGIEGIVVSLTDFRLDDLNEDLVNVEVLEIAERMDVLLEKHVEATVIGIARANPYMIFDTRIKSGVLYIEALIDYRISEWEREQLNRQIEKELEENHG